MTQRIDTSSRLIRGPSSKVYEAFSRPGAMEEWLPPPDMAGMMLAFDFRAGGRYRMRLTYKDPTQGQGKTSSDSDEVEVRFVRIDSGQRIVQEVDFVSDDPSFAGTMRMTWIFESTDQGTLVQVRAENVPEGIRADDHQAGLDASLENLARFVERRHG